MPFTVACAQFAPRKAEVAQNLDRIADLAAQAAAESADLVVFAETSTSGYFLEGGVLESALSAADLAEALASRLAGKVAKPLDLSVGFYEKESGNLYNASGYFAWDGSHLETVHVYRKFFLPTYGVFDEERFVSQGLALGVFETRFGRFGTLICEDVWHSILPTLTAIRGAQFIIVPSASPARGFGEDEIENHNRYRRILRSVSEEHGLFTVNVQLCGFEGGKGFVGGSLVVDPFGKVIAESPVQEEHLLLAEIDPELLTIARANSPLISDLRSVWGQIQRLIQDEPV